MTVCSTCGCSNFYTNDGFYFCSRCQTQLEGDQEVVFEEGTVSKAKKIDKQKKEVSNIESETLTSWEVYNYTLKYLVDRMIDLGASKDLKLIVLQLWASYLSRLQVAFCSSENVIHVNLATKKRDIKILTARTANKRRSSYFTTRYKFTRRKRRKVQLKSSDTFNESEPDLNQTRKQQLTNFKRKIAAAEYSQSEEFMQESSRILSQTQTLDDIGETSTDKSTLRIRLNDQSKLHWNAIQRAMTGKSRAERKKIIQSVINQQQESCQNIRISSVWALLQLGMILSRQKATLGDVIRWNLEGHICHRYIIELLPSEVQGEYLNTLLYHHRLTRGSVERNMSRIAALLSVTQFPPIDFNELAARYIKELNLPGELMKKVRVLLLICKPKKFFSDKVLAFDYESITMAYIIVALKLFLGLDGKTELSLSKLSNYLNSVTGSNRKKYFSWTEWTRYIECRKCVVADFHYPTRNTHCSKLQSVQSNHNSFLNYIREKRIISCSEKNKTTDLDEHIKQTLDGLGTPNKPSLEFSPSLTPLSSYSELILNDRSHQLSTEVMDLLCQKFTEQRLLLPSMYSRLSKSYKVTINVNRASLRPRKVSDLESMSDDPFPYSFGNFDVEAVILDDSKTKNSGGSLGGSGKTSNSPDRRRVESPNSHSSKKRKRRSSISVRDFDVSKKAKQLLQKRLSEVFSNKDSSNVEVNSATKSCETSKGETFTVDNPYEHYWVMHFKQSILKEDFENLSKLLFPVTFYWLLHECSNIINVGAKDLYLYVMKIEKNLHSLLSLTQ